MQKTKLRNGSVFKCHRCSREYVCYTDPVHSKNKREQNGWKATWYISDRKGVVGYLLATQVVKYLHAPQQVSNQRQDIAKLIDVHTSKKILPGISNMTCHSSIFDCMVIQVFRYGVDRHRNGYRLASQMVKPLGSAGQHSFVLGRPCLFLDGCIATGKVSSCASASFRFALCEKVTRWLWSLVDEVQNHGDPRTEGFTTQPHMNADNSVNNKSNMDCYVPLR